MDKRDQQLSWNGQEPPRSVDNRETTCRESHLGEGPLRERHEELLRRIIDTIPVMIAIAAPGAGSLQLNREFEQVLGRSGGELQASDPRERSRPDPGCEDWVRDYLRSLQPGWRDAPMTNRDGIEIETSWAGIHLSDGTQVGIGIDITLRKRAEQAIREREQRFRTLAESMPQFVWTTRADGGLSYVNRRWTEYTGLTIETTRGNGWKSIVAPEDVPRIQAVGSEAMQAGEPRAMEFRCRRASDGVYRWFLCRIQPVRNEQGELFQWIWTATDVDEQKRVQEQLEEADRRKDQFLAMLGHEMRTPLTIVSNTLELLHRRSAGNSEMERLRDRIERQMRRMARFIDDLQDITRISRGKVLLRWEVLDLAPLVRETAEDHRGALEAAGQALRLELPETPMRVKGDPARLAQVLANLLNNAGKFSDPGGEITVCLRHDEAFATVTVRDTGIGIDEAMLPHLFESFAQAEPSLERSRGGLGLGLALVKGLVELHQGEVTASSRGLGHGSEFRIRIPLARSEAQETPGRERA